LRFAGEKDRELSLIRRKKKKSIRISRVLSRDSKNMMIKSSIKLSMRKRKRERF